MLYAALCSLPLPALQSYSYRNPAMSRIFGDIVQLDWPWSAFGTLAFENGLSLLLVWTGLIGYLCLNHQKGRQLNFIKLGNGLLTSLPTLVAVSAALSELPIRHSAHGAPWMITLSPLSVLARLPFFFSLLLSIRVAKPGPRKVIAQTAA
jgi:hypothetical protein